MRKTLVLLFAAALSAVSCSKDDDHSSTPDPTGALGGVPSVHYVPGQYHLSHRLATMTENDETQYFEWSSGSVSRLTAVGLAGAARTIQYDAQGRQTVITIPATAITDEQTLHYGYSGTSLSSLLWQEGMHVMADATIASVGSRIIRVDYTDVDPLVVMQYVQDYIPQFNMGAKDLITDFSIGDIHNEYEWQDSNISAMHLTAGGSVDLQVGELVSLLNLNTDFYRMILDNVDLGAAASLVTPELIESFVALMADSNCHVTVDVDLDYTYRYTTSNNPLFGMLAWGLFDGERVLSACNLEQYRRVGEATVTAHINLPSSASSPTMMILLMYLNVAYPDGFTYSYPIDLSASDSYTYTYDKHGCPLTRTDSQGATVTFTYIENQ